MLHIRVGSYSGRRSVCVCVACQATRDSKDDYYCVREPLIRASSIDDGLCVCVQNSSDTIHLTAWYTFGIPDLSFRPLFLLLLHLLHQCQQPFDSMSPFTPNTSCKHIVRSILWQRSLNMVSWKTTSATSALQYARFLEAYRQQVSLIHLLFNITTYQHATRVEHQPLHLHLSKYQTFNYITAKRG